MLKIENVLYPESEYQKSYDSKIESGKIKLSESKVIFLGLCRDVGSVIYDNINKIIDDIGVKAKDYRIVLFENDSSDNTKEQLQTLQQQNNKIIILSQNYNRPAFGHTQETERTTALAEYRNILKNYAYKNYSDFDFVIVFDTDFLDFSAKGVYNSFGWLKEHEHISGLAGNSFQIRPVLYETPSLWNYDAWAYRGSWWTNLEYSVTNEFRNYHNMMWFGFCVLPVGSPPVRINSAFGGMCVYRSHNYWTGEYSGYDCEHVTMHYSLARNNNFLLFLNPSQIMLVE
jgi:hypothetical protein